MNKQNNGLAVLNGSGEDIPEKTILVLGSQRGGTSMVSGAIAKLGVYMGPLYKIAPLYENPDLNILAKGNTKAKVKKTIASYNKRYPIWGVKIFSRSWLFWLFQAKLREPVYIVVFRDILAIAKRRVVSLDRSLIKEMFTANWINFCLCLFLALTKRPVFILSYEKSLLAPESFVKELSSFLGIHDAEKVEDAIEFIKPSPSKYVMHSTTNCQLDKDAQFFGYLDLIEPDRIAGWATSLSEQNPLNIELLVNGQRKLTVKANAVREDVQKADARYQRHCGFSIHLQGQDELKKGDRVEVRVLDKNFHLVNSPYIIE